MELNIKNEPQTYFIEQVNIKQESGYPKLSQQSQPKLETGLYEIVMKTEVYTVNEINTSHLEQNSDLVVKEKIKTKGVDLKHERLTEECNFSVRNCSDGPSSSKQSHPLFQCSNSTKKSIIKKKKQYSCPVCTKNTLAVHADFSNELDVEKLNLLSSEFTSWYLPTPASRKVHLSRHFYQRCVTCHLCGTLFVLESMYRSHLFGHFVKKRLQCGVCYKWFSVKSELTDHMLTHFATKPFKCNICLQTFMSDVDCFQHKIKFHGRQAQDTYYNCKICSLMFPQRLQLVRHMGIHQLSKSFDCVVCLKDFSLCGSLDHLKLMSRRIFCCRICPTSFKNRRTYNRHILKHSKQKMSLELPAKRFKCEVCLLVYCKKESLDDHILTHVSTTESKVYKCEVCSIEFKQKQVFENHIAINTLQEPYNCKYCSHQYILKCHQFSDCIKNNNVQCKICSEQLVSVKNLNNHISSHARNNKFLCNICFQMFRIHVKQTFNREGKEIPFNCKICSKDFLDRQQFLAHFKTHISDKRFSCESCSRQSVSDCKKQLHKTVKLVKCVLCSGLFSSKYYLEHQRRQHSGEKPFRCDICGKAFASKQSLRCHAFIHGSEKPFKCEICLQQFVRSKSLETHMRCHNIRSLLEKSN